MRDLRLAVNAATPASGEALTNKLVARKLGFRYGDTQALRDVSIDIPERRVTALIGPSGCGKSTLLRVFNRIYAIYPKQVADGEVLLDGEDILGPKYPLSRLRSKIGMVFQKPVPFPMSIYENVAYAIPMKPVRKGSSNGLNAKQARFGKASKRNCAPSSRRPAP